MDSGDARVLMGSVRGMRLERSAKKDQQGKIEFMTARCATLLLYNTDTANTEDVKS